MIVDLHKYLIFGPEKEMDRFFEMAQGAGFMEFIGLSHKKALEMPDGCKVILSAIKIARAHTAEGNEPYRPKLSAVQLSEKIVQLNIDHERKQEEKRILKAEIARIAPFGDFSREELSLFEKEGKRTVQFFILKSELAKGRTFPPEVIYLGTEYDLAYFMAINKERMQYPKMVEVFIERPVGELKQRLKEVDKEIELTEKQIHDSARALPYLQKALVDDLNEYHLHLAKHDVAKPISDTFAIEAWVPETKVKALFSLLSNLQIVAEEVSIDPDDKMPTCMENHGNSKIGEDLVQVYDTPSPTDQDPSLWILIFFTFFFAIIIADAGYGLIYLLTALYFKWKLKDPSPTTRRFLKLAVIISSACIVWGVFTASFFGIHIGPENPLRKISILHYMAVKKADYHIRVKDETYDEYVKLYPAVGEASTGQEFLMKGTRENDGEIQHTVMEDFYDTALLEFSLFIGTIHLLLSFVRYLGRNWTGFGWILFLVGGYLFFPKFVEATSLVQYLGWFSKENAYFYGKQMLFAGLALVFILALIQKRKIGAALHELTNSVQVFADVLSYLRLYALALAGIVMAETFNSLGAAVGIFGVFIIIAGHAINLSLAIMSGTIHGLRLNFLEWYHYSFEGGGRTFNPLRIRKVK